MNNGNKQAWRIFVNKIRELKQRQQTIVRNFLKKAEQKKIDKIRQRIAGV